VFGSHPREMDWNQAPASLAFAFGGTSRQPDASSEGSLEPTAPPWLGGIAVAAQRMAVVCGDKELEPEAVRQMHRRWLLYWGQYWQRKGGSDPLPEDPLCEATPAH
jgi:hypothetical protein